jgi:hypothetical protein
MRGLVERLNALTDEWHPWEWTHARKQHADWFGDRIQPGEEYLKRRYGEAHHAYVKLSSRSLDRVLFVLFGANPLFEMIAERLKEVRARERDTQMRKALESMAELVLPKRSQR